MTVNRISRLALGLLPVAIAASALWLGPATRAQALAPAAGRVVLSVDHGAFDTAFDVSATATPGGTETPCVTDPANDSTHFGLFVANLGAELQPPSSYIVAGTGGLFPDSVQNGQTLSAVQASGISFDLLANFADLGDAFPLKTETGTFSIGVMCFVDVQAPPIVAYWMSVTFDGAGNWTLSATTPSTTATTPTGTTGTTDTTPSTATTTTTTATTTTASTSADTSTTDTSATDTSTTDTTITTPPSSSAAVLTPLAVLAWPGGQALPVNPTLHRGDRITVVGSGFDRDEAVEVVAQSAPISLVTAHADNGGFSQLITIPAGLPPGPHALVLTGVTSRASVNLAFTVAAPATSTSTTRSTAATSPTTATSTTPTSTGQPSSRFPTTQRPPAGNPNQAGNGSGGNINGHPGSADQLANTGGPYTLLIAAGLILLLFGGGFQLLARRNAEPRRPVH